MEDKRKEKGRVIKQKKIGKDIYSMWIETKLSENGKPGQFIAIYPKGESTLLPRPISICERDKERGMLRIVYRAVGKGTKEFSQYKEGETIHVMGSSSMGELVSLLYWNWQRSIKGKRKLSLVLKRRDLWKRNFCPMVV